MARNIDKSKPPVVVDSKEKFSKEPHWAILEFTQIAVYSGWEKPGESADLRNSSNYLAFSIKEDWEKAIRDREIARLSGQRINDYVASYVIPAKTEININIKVWGQEEQGKKE